MWQLMSGYILTIQNFSTLLKQRWTSAPESVRPDLAIDIATARDSFRPGDRWIWFIHELGTALVRSVDADINTLTSLSRKKGEWLAIQVNHQDALKGVAKSVSWPEIESIVTTDQLHNRRLTRQPINHMITQIAHRVAGTLGLGAENTDHIKHTIYELLEGTQKPGTYLLIVNNVLGRISCINMEDGVANNIEPGEHLVHIDVLSDVRYGSWIDGGTFTGLH